MRHGRGIGIAFALLAAGCPASGGDDGDDGDGGDGSSGAESSSTTAAGEDTAVGSEDGSTAAAPDDDGAATDTGSSTGEPQGGCGRDPGFTGAVTGQIEADGDNRHFILVLPDDYDPDRAYPLVFMLHGLGSNAEQMRMYGGVEEAAGGDALLVYPDGLPVPTAGNQPGWNFGAGGPDVALFDVLVEEFSNNLCVDPERIFASGHSHGGFMSNALGCVRGDVVRAVAPVAGGVGGSVCVGQVAAWLAHNPDDATVPLALGQLARDQWIEANHCGARTEAVDPDPCVQYVGCDEGFPVVWCEHDETFGPIGAHTWPSFAGAAIWAFFSQF